MENFFNEYKLDAVLNTETWLQNTNEDDTWLQASEFHKGNHEIFNMNKQDKRGGGIALLYYTKYKIKTVMHTNTMILKVEFGTSNLDQHIAHYYVCTTHWLECNKE